jgi:Putative Flp pilus-assembly TadE/G-like
VNRLRNERGQAAVLSIVFLAALLGAFSLVLDVGSWFREQRSAQSAADAAALAGAQALPDNTGTSSALASQYLAENGGGTGEFEWSSKNLANDTITVRVTRQAPGVFSKLFGIESVDVHAKASARSGSIDRARYAAPIAVDRAHPLLNCTPLPCFNQATTLDLKKTGPGAFRLLNLDRTHGGSGGQITADWIQKGFNGYMALGWYQSDPGAAFNDNKVKQALDIRLGDELLFPIYDQVKGGGSNFEYRVVGWVGFVVTGFASGGSDGTVDGHFVRVIWEGIQSEDGAEEDFGVRTVQLVD